MQANRTGILRGLLVALAILLQLGLLIFLVIRLREYSLRIFFLLEMMGVLMVLYIFYSSKNTSFKAAWGFVILVLPVFGVLLYFLWGQPRLWGKHKTMHEVLQYGIGLRDENIEYLETFNKEHPQRRRIPNYLQEQGFPLCRNTICDYYGLGEWQFQQMLKDLEEAQEFIFMEYFILGAGELWDSIYAVLKKKAEAGLDVRILYDAFGCLLVLPEDFDKVMQQSGIRTKNFNPVFRHLSRFYINYRNHQKIVVIDGKIAYTGGTNLADEYANLYEKHGHWKDMAVRLRGEAVWPLTVNFLQMWDSQSTRTDRYEDYFRPHDITATGYFQPFYDGPYNNPENPAEDMYLQMLATALDYVYITTPYLVVDDGMIDAIILSARSGVDVRIITPKIWDKWYVHMVTRSNYQKLLEAGVRIYEYTPGYIHAKTIISDDVNAIVGSINMDYRSFYLHYENGIWIYEDPVIQEILEDIREIMRVSEEIDLESWEQRPRHEKFIQMILRLFAPLL